MKSLPWFRMYSDFIHDEMVEMLAFEDQRHFVFLLCMKNAGSLDKDYPSDGMLDSVVSRRLGIFGEALVSAKRRMMEVGLIDANWQPTGWDKRQFVSDANPTNAERQKRYREAHKSTAKDSNVTRNVTVTLTDTDTDTDTEVNLEPAKQARKKATAIPSDFYPNENGVAYADEKRIAFAVELESFRNWHLAKGGVFKDWQACWRTWCDKAVEYGRAGKPQVVKSNGQAPLPDFMRGAL